MTRRHEKPLKRVNPSGKTVWVARWTDRNGKRHSGMPAHGIPGTYELKREAQVAIDRCYDLDLASRPAPSERPTVGEYAKRWTKRHPRAKPTNRAYGTRLRAVLDVELEGRPFRDWPMEEVRPRAVADLLDHLLCEQGRAASGASAVLAVLSTMWRDAIHDDATIYNPFQDAPRIRATDPRVSKPKRKVRIYTWEQMHALAAAAPGRYGEAMIRCLSDCGLRLGEMLPLERGDLRLSGCEEPLCRAGGVPHLHVERTASDGSVEAGTKTTRGQDVLGRAVPVSEGLEALLRALPPRLDTRLLFPSEPGRGVTFQKDGRALPWFAYGHRNDRQYGIGHFATEREAEAAVAEWRLAHPVRSRVIQNSAFYSRIWYPARAKVPGMEAAYPHELRHTWVTRMRAVGVDPEDAALVAGHSLNTASQVYSHALGLSYEAMRRAVGP